MIRLEVTREVIEQLQSVVASNMDEVCGVFTGSITRSGVYRINNLSPILTTNDSSKYSCIRDAEKANKFINEDFCHSNGSRVYFGEWHTHLESNPNPSCVDKKSIYKIYNTEKLPLGLVFFAIVGWNGIYWGYFDGKTFVRITTIGIV